jgi:DNA-binding transcriptional regulator YhcF (GntR family)
MLLRLDDRDDVPLYLQIAASVRGAIANGELAPGDRLPTARTLAASLGVNMHTVLRGYAELEEEGLVSLRRGRGVLVTAESPGRARLLELVREVGREARRLGITPDEVEAMVREHV